MPDVRLIDGNALVKQIEEVHCKGCNNYNGVMCRACTWMDAMDYIEDAPTVDTQPVKHGHWIRKDIFYVCSECGIELIDDCFEQIAIFPDGYMPFCPNCGRRMTY